MTTAACSRRRRPRLGFLGVGWIGRNRLDAVVESGLAEVSIVADPSEEARLAAAASAGCPAVATGIEELLDGDLDAVVIATPSALHAEQSVAAIERGLAVFCQKPLARDGREAARVVNAARDADRLLGVDFSYRHVSAVGAVRSLVQSGQLGDVFAIDAVFHNAYGPDKGWCRDRRLSGGGCLIDLGVHLVDTALWILGFPAAVRASARLYSQGRPFDAASDAVEDFATARIDLSSGTALSLSCSWNLPAGRDAVIRLACYGTRGGAAVENVAGSFYDFRAVRYRGTSTELLTDARESWGGRAIVSWADCLARGAGFTSEAEQFLQVARAIDMVYAS